MIPSEDAERFWSHVDRSRLSPGGCWLWTGMKDDDGYGRITVLGRRYSTHRLAFIIGYGAIQRGLHVLHRCDTPACVNPDHLRTGTHAENMAERGERRRAAVGERNGRAKLGGAVWVRAIRDLYRTGSYSYQTLAELFLINERTVIDIVSGRIWKDIA